MILPNLSLEKSLWEKGYDNIVGIDEAGRGPLAGPVTVGAVIIHSEDQVVNIVRDSKKMTAGQREKAFEEICRLSSAFAVGIVSAEEIDEIGIQNAIKKAMLMALKKIEEKFMIDISYVLIDGSKTASLENYKSSCIVKGDQLHYSISAASVLAKVTRDRLMKDFSILYPKYGFHRHVGYGTPEHIKAINEYGPCPIHRKTFFPVKNFFKSNETY